MDLEDFRDELRFRQDIAYFDMLIETFFWRLHSENISVEKYRELWNDIRTYGDEPVFTDLLMERAFREANVNGR